MRRCLASALVLGLVASASAIAHADGKPMSVSAKAELERGMELFEAKDYAAAIATFDAGFELEPHPDFLYAKGQAQRMSGDCAGAIESYRGFLASSPPEEETRITRFNVARCETELEHEREAAKANEMVPGPAWYRDPLGGVLAGGAVIGLGVGVTFLFLADRNVDNANDAEFLETYLDEKTLASNRRTIATVAFIAGGALASAAIIRYATRPDRVHVVAMPAPAGAIVGIGGRF